MRSCEACVLGADRTLRLFATTRPTGMTPLTTRMSSLVGVLPLGSGCGPQANAAAALPPAITVTAVAAMAPAWAMNRPWVNLLMIVLQFVYSTGAGLL